MHSERDRFTGIFDDDVTTITGHWELLGDDGSWHAWTDITADQALSSLSPCAQAVRAREAALPMQSAVSPQQNLQRPTRFQPMTRRTAQ
jgi:hypothetical protein